MPRGTETTKAVRYRKAAPSPKPLPHKNGERSKRALRASVRYLANTYSVLSNNARTELSS